jgi:DNA-directed RNA polymerase subunit RPC12/RpoP
MCRLYYPCAACGKQVALKVEAGEDSFWLDDGSTLFCPNCGQGTVVHFARGVSSSEALKSALLALLHGVRQYVPQPLAPGLVEGVRLAEDVLSEGERS